MPYAVSRPLWGNRKAQAAIPAAKGDGPNETVGSSLSPQELLTESLSVMTAHVEAAVSPQPADAVQRSNERCGIREGADTAVMQGVGENYFTAFALLLRASTSHIGLLTALPAFLGSFAQLASILWLRWFDRRQRVVVAAALAQA